MKTIILSLALVILIGNPCLAQDGYGKTRWGMSVDQVLAMEPQAHKTEKPNSWADGSKGLLVIDSVAVDYLKFSLSFAFLNSELVLVQLNNSKKGADSCYDGQLIFTRIKELLVIKYGKPDYEHNDRVLNSKDIVWKAGSTRINALYMEIDGTKVGLGCSYYNTITYTPLKTEGNL